MASIVVCGGSMIGLTSAMLLAREGHDVVVLEHDPAPPPSRAVDAWERNGVPQFRQPHNLFPRIRAVLREELPWVFERLVDAGCTWWAPLATMPPTITDRNPRAGDDRFRFITGRRPVTEAVLANAAAEHEGVSIRRGIGVGELVVAPSLVDHAPHVVGVRTTDGEALDADLVVDAMGRRSPLVDWITALGARAPVLESVDQGFVYYTRYYRGTGEPPFIGPPLTPMGTFTLLTLPGDNNTWSITIWAAASDALLRKVRDPDRFTEVVRACPLHQHWLQGEPITDVLAMASILDKYRRFVHDGQPVATGVASVGDAWACTNPSYGRGISVGMVHAQCLRDAVHADLDDPVTLALTFDELTEDKAAPFFWFQVENDRRRIAEMDALREGREPPRADPRTVLFEKAAMHDADVFRAFLEIRMCLATAPEVFARPEIMERLDAYRDAQVLQIPGPDREDLVKILS